MIIHQLITDRLTACLGEPDRLGNQRVWRVDVGNTRINIVVDLPRQLNGPRVWIFDPSRREESVAQYPVQNADDVDRIVAQVITQTIPGVVD